MQKKKQYNAYREIQNIIGLRISQKAIKQAIDELIAKSIVFKDYDRLDIVLDKKIELFPSAIKNKRYHDYVDELLRNSNYSWYRYPEDYLRNFLLGGFIKKNENYRQSINWLIENSESFFYTFLYMTGRPEYDDIWECSKELTSSIMNMLSGNIMYLMDEHAKILDFFQRNPKINERFIKARIELFRGNIDYALKECANPINYEELLLRAQIELFRGNYEQSVALFDKARVTDLIGIKMSRIDFDAANEFFYWLSWAMASFFP